MSNLAFLEYVQRINNALGLDQLETVAEELKRADILPDMHEGMPPENLTERTRNEYLLGRFLLIMDRRAYEMITPWLNQVLEIFSAEQPKA